MFLNGEHFFIKVVQEGLRVLLSQLFLFLLLHFEQQPQHQVVFSRGPLLFAVHIAEAGLEARVSLRPLLRTHFFLVLIEKAL